MEAIELTAQGLLLRPWHVADADLVHRACQDPMIQRWTTVAVPYEHAHAVDFVGWYTEQSWASGDAAPLGVFDAGTGDLLGAHGLVRLDRNAGTAEAGTWVAPWARGRGVAERATRAVAHWALDILRLDLLGWHVEVGNHASRLVAERVGFAFDGVSRAAMTSRRGGLVDSWRGTLRPGEIRDSPPRWYAPGAPGAIRAATFGRPQPVLEAGPLRLRPVAERDRDAMVLACQDPESARWTTVPVPYHPADATSFRNARAVTGWARGTAATFTIADPDDRSAGTVDIRLDPVDPAAGEIGVLVAPQARGHGYATAAASAICAWSFDALGVTRIVWRAHVGNEASRRVAEKVGFVAEGVQRAGCDQRGERRDAWIGSLLAGDAGREPLRPAPGCALAQSPRLITP
ncbi:MAG TPA: GNAT family N-acetyltransferase [Micromonosporaceae bacterium]|nr:GNAT family N-acetyltransferase [Micromonosporaceae bacterium]